jgi:HD-GYP domain-containing protein (c-di-GMP phosphodiesterase class II)
LSYYSIQQLIDTAIAISTEKDIDALLWKIIDDAIGITNCDGGTVYIRNGDYLLFHNIVTRSKNIRVIQHEEDEQKLPPVPVDSKSHVCACAAMSGEKINIADVYTSVEYDFAGAQRYDKLNGYRTKSMLVIPMVDEKFNNIGVLQLINAMDEKGNVIPFDPSYESLISALASLASVGLNNNQLSKALNELLHSFVSVMVDAIDARSLYNANHTRNMVEYGKKFVEWLDETNNEMRIPEEEQDPFIMSIWLHDIGKLAVPLEIMDKPTRLGDRENDVMHRIETAVLMEKINALSEPSKAESAEKMIAELVEIRETISKANVAGFLDDEIMEKLTALKEMKVLASDGSLTNLLDDDEYNKITVRKGTLTKEERLEMERHVVYTERFLSKMKFRGKYSIVPTWASEHHEYLNGTGYPNGIGADKLSKYVRILTIIDIYDALTAVDRPYKHAMPAEKAFDILYEMCDEGKIDRHILTLFHESNAWVRNN